MITEALCMENSQGTASVGVINRAGNSLKRSTYMKRYGTLYLLLCLPILFFVIFRYVPMVYIVGAFKQNNTIKPLWEVPWAKNNGFEFFIKAFNDRDFLNALRNTLMLNLLDLVIGFPAPVILALLLNELTFKKLKKVTQTIVYLPHFLSWIIISGLALKLFAPTDGLVNLLIKRLGGEAIPFLNKSNYWVGTYIALGIWKDAGWNTIIYLAAITAINPELYEAAAVDGASRMQKLWHVTLPGIRSTIVILLIMSIGRIIGSEFDRPYALGNKLVNDVSNVISIYVYQRGIRGINFSLTTAVGLFQSVVGVFFLLGANAFAKKFGERGIW